MEIPVNRADALLAAASELTSRAGGLTEEVVNSVYVLLTEAHAEIDKIGKLRDRLAVIWLGGSAGLPELGIRQAAAGLHLRRLQPEPV